METSYKFLDCMYGKKELHKLSILTTRSTCPTERITKYIALNRVQMGANAITQDPNIAVNT